MNICIAVALIKFLSAFVPNIPPSFPEQSSAKQASSTPAILNSFPVTEAGTGDETTCSDPFDMLLYDIPASELLLTKPTTEAVSNTTHRAVDEDVVQGYLPRRSQPAASLRCRIGDRGSKFVSCSCSPGGCSTFPCIGYVSFTFLAHSSTSILLDTILIVTKQ